VKVALYLLGAFLELSGILFLAAPDLVPGALGLSRWTSTHWQTIESRLRRLLHLPIRRTVYADAVTGTMTMGGSAVGITSMSSEATLEQKVEFLLRRDQESQHTENRLGERVRDVERELARQLNELRGAMVEHVDRRLTAAQADYRTAREIGTAALVLGLAMTTWANFI
jgi:hypothetical protein